MGLSKSCPSSGGQVKFNSNHDSSAGRNEGCCDEGIRMDVKRSSPENRLASVCASYPSSSDQVKSKSSHNSDVGKSTIKTTKLENGSSSISSDSKIRSKEIISDGLSVAHLEKNGSDSR